MEGPIISALMDELHKRELEETNHVIRGLKTKLYHQACGRIQTLRDVRETILPEIIDKLRKD